MSSLVLDTAKELQTLHICEKWQSSSVIKKMLDDETNKRLITARWKHEVLPAEFKRGYRKHRYEKREVSSLSSTQSPICAVSGAQTAVKTIASPERYITITRAIPSSHVFDVSSRNLNAGSDETFLGLWLMSMLKTALNLKIFPSLMIWHIQIQVWIPPMSTAFKSLLQLN